MSKYKIWPEKVVAGKVVTGELVKLSCERFLSWFSREDLEFREDAVDRVINFIQKLKHYTGRHSGKPFKLLDYQVWIVASIFGWYRKGTSKRVTRYVYLELARKSGKTALVAAILLYMLVADGENAAEVELVANSAKQAKICFEMASRYLGSIDPKGKYFGRFRDTIKFDRTKSKIQVLSSDSSGLDGFNSSCFVLDEAHEQKDSSLWDVMCSSQGMRENPLGIIITTAGFSRSGFCYSYRESCENILRGIANSDYQFSAIFCLDPEDDWQNEGVWIKSNPSLGQTVSLDYLRIEAEKAKNLTSLERGFRTKNLNQWLSAGQDTWISDDDILECMGDLDWEDLTGSEAYMGVDLAAVGDLTAWSLMIPKDDKLYFRTWYYLPKDTIENNSNRELYKTWEKEGDLIITPGNVTDYDYVLSDMLEQSKNFQVRSVAYDQYNATQWAIDATTAGLELEPFSQALWNFNKPTKELEMKIKSRCAVIARNSVTRWCFENTVLKFDHNENCKPVKYSSPLKIDGVVAMIQALGRYLEAPRYSYKIG